MAFPAQQISLESALENIASTAGRVRTQAQSLSDRSAAGGVPREEFLRLQKALQHAVDVWDANASVSGLAQYAQDQYNTPTLDMAAEYTAMRAAAISLRDWIFVALPTAIDGALRLFLTNARGEETSILVTTSQSAPFRAEVAAFTATIS